MRSNRAVEWDRRTGDWRPVHLDERIVHACLAAPLPIRAMLETARADEAVLSALEARRPDLIARIEARGEARGEARAIRRFCRLLGVPIDEVRSAQLDSANLEQLRSISSTLEAERRWPEPVPAE